MHLYLHIPFCHRICPYCSFYKHTPGKTDLAAFVRALLAEASHFHTSTEDHPPVETLYLGGGTPSMLSPAHLKTLMLGLGQHFEFSDRSEITLEANPATFTSRTADLYRELGVTRVSLGAQSFDPDVLTTLGREHSPEQAVESVHLLREAGMPSINIDLMFSIPGQDDDSWRTTLEEAAALQPNHLSCYNLTYEEDTPFFEMQKDGRMNDDDERNARQFLLADQLLGERGFHHYETSNYAQPGHESQHNQAYWEGADYLGLGPSAVSTVDGVRWKNAPDTAAYLRMVDTVGHARTEEESLGATELQTERIALLLRTSKGVPLEVFSESATPVLARLQDQGLGETSKGRFRLVGDAPLFVDSIAAELIC